MKALQKPSSEVILALVKPLYFCQVLFLLLFEFSSRKSSIQFCTSGVLIRSLMKCLTILYNFLMHIKPFSFTRTHFIRDGVLRMPCSNANHLMITQPSSHSHEHVHPLSAHNLFMSYLLTAQGSHLRTSTAVHTVCSMTTPSGP